MAFLINRCLIAIELIKLGKVSWKVITFPYRSFYCAYKLYPPKFREFNISTNTTALAIL